MSKKADNEAWDEGIPKRMDLVEGEQYKVTIQALRYGKNQWGKNSLQIDTEFGTIITGAWNVVNFLRDNKPVVGRKFKFQVQGQGIARRFINLEIE